MNPAKNVNPKYVELAQQAMTLQQIDLWAFTMNFSRLFDFK
jgi:hypothetical protein